MIKIYSQVKPGLMTHVSFKTKDAMIFRSDMTSDNEFIQAAFKRDAKGMTYDAHYHIQNERKFSHTQEVWVIMKGRVRVTLYDIDQSYLDTLELVEGSCIITMHGGHAYEIMEDDTIWFEFKNGPYQGRENDKRMIEKQSVGKINEEN